MISKGISGAIMLSCVICILLLHVTPAWADVPHNITFQFGTSGTHKIVTITITHDSGAPTSTHYVDLAQIEVDGIIHDINLSPQTEVTFSVEYDLGETADIPPVRSRAHCILHGWSSWQDAVVPTPSPTSTPVPTTVPPTTVPQTTAPPTTAPPVVAPVDYTMYYVIGGIIAVIVIAAIVWLLRRK